jgi:hypothetical protein
MSLDYTGCPPMYDPLKLLQIRWSFRKINKKKRISLIFAKNFLAILKFAKQFAKTANLIPPFEFQMRTPNLYFILLFYVKFHVQSTIHSFFAIRGFANSAKYHEHQKLTEMYLCNISFHNVFPS